MHRHRMTIAFCVFGVGCAGLFAALLGFQADSAAGQVKAVKATVISVTAGKPSELAFKLSKTSNITAGPVTFKVTNAGVLSHDFKICTTPVTKLTANACVGKVTPLLAKGKSATLTVTLKKGQYEFLCTVPGHAKWRDERRDRSRRESDPDRRRRRDHDDDDDPAWRRNHDDDVLDHRWRDDDREGSTDR